MDCLDLEIFEFCAVKDYQHMNKFMSNNLQVLPFIQIERSAKFNKRNILNFQYFQVSMDVLLLRE